MQQKASGQVVQRADKLYITASVNSQLFKLGNVDVDVYS